MKKCPKCSKEYYDFLVTCSSCKVPLITTETKQGVSKHIDEQTKPTYFQKGWLIAIGVILGIVILSSITSTQHAFNMGYGAIVADREDMARALIIYLRMGYDVFQTPNYRGNFRADCLYSLDNMMSVIMPQSITDGVIISSDPYGERGLAFLYTNEKFHAGTHLHGWARFTGVKQFGEKYLPTFRMDIEK